MKKYLYPLLLALAACGTATAPAAAAGKETPGLTQADMEKYHHAVCKIIVGNNGEAEGCGTCFLVSKDGYFITNYHVVEGSTQFFVFIRNPKTGQTESLPVQPTRVDVDHDLALLKATRTTALPAPLKLETGTATTATLQDVVAIGFPAVLDELEQEMAEERGELPLAEGEDGPGLPIYTKGSIAKISAERITHTATIAPGNSGGPLVSATTGNVVGVNYMLVSETGSTYFFALPVNFVVNLMNGTGGMAYKQLPPAAKSADNGDEDNDEEDDDDDTADDEGDDEDDDSPEMAVMKAKLQAVSGVMEILTLDSTGEIAEDMADGIDEITEALKELNRKAKDLDQAALDAADEALAEDEKYAKVPDRFAKQLEELAKKDFHGCKHLQKAIEDFVDAL